MVNGENRYTQIQPKAEGLRTKANTAARYTLQAASKYRSAESLKQKVQSEYKRERQRRCSDLSLLASLLHSTFVIQHSRIHFSFLFLHFSFPCLPFDIHHLTFNIRHLSSLSHFSFFIPHFSFLRLPAQSIPHRQCCCGWRR